MIFAETRADGPGAAASLRRVPTGDTNVNGFFAGRNIGEVHAADIGSSREIRKAGADEKARELLGHQVRVLYQIAASDGQPLAAIGVVPADCGF